MQQLPVQRLQLSLHLLLQQLRRFIYHVASSWFIQLLMPMLVPQPLLGLELKLRPLPQLELMLELEPMLELVLMLVPQLVLMPMPTLMLVPQLMLMPQLVPRPKHQPGLLPIIQPKLGPEPLIDQLVVVLQQQLEQQLEHLDQQQLLQVIVEHLELKLMQLVHQQQGPLGLPNHLRAFDSFAKVIPVTIPQLRLSRFPWKESFLISSMNLFVDSIGS